MITRGGSILGLLLSFIPYVAMGYSNPIEGGSTETVTNHWNVPALHLVIGGNSGGNTMAVSSGGQVDSQFGIIGNNLSSTHNSALVTGPGSVWSSAMELSVGNLGASNTLAVGNGGRVNTLSGYIGHNSGGNQANIDGAGSVLNATTLHVGHLAGANAMTVSNGGRVESVNGTVGYWFGADDNTATVSGPESIWANSGALNVGEYGSGNALNIESGGHVDSPIVNLGVQSISSNNLVSVSGNGSRLDAVELNIGGTASTAGGTGNRVEVQSGGTVATTDLTIMPATASISTTAAPLPSTTTSTPP